MAETTSPTARRSPVWMRALLGVSLALNLAVLGVGVGIGLRLTGPSGPPPHTFGGALIRALPSDDRKEITRQARHMMGPRLDHRAEAAQLIAALRAAPYDHPAVTELLEAQSAGRFAWAQALQTSWLDRVQAMSPEERSAYAASLEAAEKRRQEQHKKHPKFKGQGN